LIARLAKAEEIPELLQRIKDSGGVFVDLNRTPCWVAVDGEKIVGLLAAELTWQFEPLLMFPEIKSKATRRRACFELYRAAESWMEGSGNITGVYKAFAVTRMFGVRSWAKKMGWLHQFKRAPLFIKHFRSNHGQ
jgi:hypothetical protein